MVAFSIHVMNRGLPCLESTFRIGLYLLLAASLPFKYYGDSVRLRRRLPRYLLDPTPSHSASDAIAYSDTYNSLTKYIVCSICGIEGSCVGCVSVADVGDLLEMSRIATKFNNVVCSDRCKTRYDTIFNQELDTHFKVYYL